MSGIAEIAEALLDCCQVVRCLKTFYCLINGSSAAGSEQGMFLIQQELRESHFDFPNQAAQELYVFLLENSTLQRPPPEPLPLPPPPPLRATASNIVVDRGYYGYFGVASVSGSAQYCAQLHLDGVAQLLGTFDTAADASEVVCRSYLKMYGMMPPERTSRGQHHAWQPLSQRFSPLQCLC